MATPITDWGWWGDKLFMRDGKQYEFPEQWTEGYHTCDVLDGREGAINPYPHDTWEWAAWINGWNTRVYELAEGSD